MKCYAAQTLNTIYFLSSFLHINTLYGNWGTRGFITLNHRGGNIANKMEVGEPKGNCGLSIIFSNK